jgi:hypothetical protein
MKNYGTLSSPDDVEEEEVKAWDAGEGVDVEGASANTLTLSKVDVENVVGEEEEDDLIPFLDDHELEAQQLIEATRALSDKKPSSLFTKKTTGFAAGSLVTIVALFCLFLVYSRSSLAESDGETPIFESSGVMSNSTSSS